MALYLVQHGQCLSKDQDPQKGLSPQGFAQVQRIAQVAAGYGIQPANIDHSGKKRALQTAQIMADELKPENGVGVIQGINPLDDVAAFAASVDSSHDSMIVGHLPFLEKLVTFLITGQLTPPVFRMQNGGIVCLDLYPGSRQLAVKWALMPEIK